jgi:hypothetical protein
MLNTIRTRLQDGFTLWYVHVQDVITLETHNLRILTRTKAILCRLTHGIQNKIWNTWINFVFEQKRKRKST